MLTLLTALLFAAPKNPAHLSEWLVPQAEAASISESTTTIAAFVRLVQKQYGLADDFYDTLEYESAGFQNIQSEIVTNGKRELSFGIAQINLLVHPDISRERALDVQWAVTWAGKEFAAGRKSQWTGWRVVTR